MHPRAIAEEVGLSMGDVCAALQVLESPDRESRSPEEDGRRIVLMDEHRAWGWRVVNYAKYRAIRNEDDRREQNRLSQAKWREAHKNSKQRKPPSAQAEAEAKALNTTPPFSPSVKKARKPPLAVADGVVWKTFERFWKAYPASTRKVARLQCWAKWKARGLDELADQIVAHVEAMTTSDAWTKDGGQFAPAPMVYLNQSRWEAPTEAQTAESRACTDWRATGGSIVKKGRAMGVGDWTEALWVAGKAPDFPTYRKRVDEAVTKAETKEPM